MLPDDVWLENCLTLLRGLYRVKVTRSMDEPAAAAKSNVEVSVQAVPQRRRLIFKLISIAALVATVICAVIGLVLTRTNGAEDPSWGVPLGIAGALLASVGALLTVRLPSHIVGWLMLTSGLLFASATAAAGLADATLNVNPGSIAGGTWLFWWSQSAATPAIAISAGFLPLYFPTGKLPSARWRVIVVIGVIATAAATLQAALSQWPTGIVPATNPLDPGPGAQPFLAILGVVAVALGALAFCAAIGSLLVRLRHASDIERQQLKWFAAIVVLTVPATLVSILVANVTSGWLSVVNIVSSAIAVIGAMLAPITVGIAILRYRLYDIDLVVRRTAVYVPMTAILAGLFAASTVLLQRLFVVATGNQSDAAVVLATLILATAFTPVRTAIQSVVDRTFRDSLDTERRLKVFTDGVAASLSAPDRARTLRAFLPIAVSAVHAAGGTAVVVNRAGEHRVGETANRGTGSVIQLAIGTDEQRIGRLELDPPANGRAFAPRELGLLMSACGTLAEAISGTDGRSVP